MLAVFERAGVTGVCCVVTRYFGGVLLGAGGLVRAYTRAASDALEAAGVAAVRRWAEMETRCPYSFLERVKRLTACAGGLVEGVDYADEVTLRALVPLEAAGSFSAALRELSAGAFEARALGEVDRPGPA